MAICYWCGKEVLNGEGAREHVIPRTLLQDVADDVSDFVIPAEKIPSDELPAIVKLFLEQIPHKAGRFMLATLGE